jgi:hypothetical protein
MIDDFDDDPVKQAEFTGIPHGYERGADGVIRPILELDFVSRIASPTRRVHPSNAPELWPIAAEAYAATGRMSAAAAAMGCSTQALYKLHSNNEDFAELIAEAKATYAARVQAEVVRRGMTGVDKPVFYKGVIAGYERQYSDTLLVLEARRAHPEYREILASPKAGQTTVNVNTTSVAVAGTPAAQALASLQTAQLTPEQRLALRALVTRPSAPEPVAGTPEASTALLDVHAEPTGHSAAHSAGSGGVYAPGTPQHAVPTADHAPGTGHAVHGGTHAAHGSTEPVLGTAQYALPSAGHAATPVLPSTEHGDHARECYAAESDPPQPTGGLPEAPGLPKDGREG